MSSKPQSYICIITFPWIICHVYLVKPFRETVSCSLHACQTACHVSTCVYWWHCNGDCLTNLRGRENFLAKQNSTHRAFYIFLYSCSGQLRNCYINLRSLDNKVCFAVKSTRFLSQMYQQSSARLSGLFMYIIVSLAVRTFRYSGNHYLVFFQTKLASLCL